MACMLLSPLAGFATDEALMLAYILKNLGHRWYEYALGAAIVALVASTLTVQRSLSGSAEAQVHDLAHELGRNMLVLPSDTDLQGFYGYRFGDATLPDSYPVDVQRSSIDQHISVTQARLYGNVEAGEEPIVLIGERNHLQGGRIEHPVPNGMAMLSERAAQTLATRDASEVVEVHGVALDVAPAGGELQHAPAEAILIAMDTAQSVLGKEGRINAMRLAGCWCRIDIPTLASQVEALLPGARAITVAGVLEAQQGTIAEARSYSDLLHLVAVLLIAAVAGLIVALQVRRQRREIGLLLAIGGRPPLVGGLFVAKAGLMGVAGALGGYLLGVPLTEYAAGHLIGLPVPVTSETLGFLVGLAALVSVVAATIPALRAVRRDPTVALREI